MGSNEAIERVAEKELNQFHAEQQLGSWRWNKRRNRYASGSDTPLPWTWATHKLPPEGWVPPPRKRGGKGAQGGRGSTGGKGLRQVTLQSPVAFFEGIKRSGTPAKMLGVGRLLALGHIRELAMMDEYLNHESRAAGYVMDNRVGTQEESVDQEEGLRPLPEPVVIDEDEAPEVVKGRFEHEEASRR